MSAALRSFCAILLVMTVGAGGAGAFPFGGAKSLSPVDGEVTIPRSSVGGGKARFFRVKEGGREISFFVVTDSRGGVKAAFDACDACWREKKGYQQEGAFMKCRNCGQKFAIDRLGPNATGGCNPGFLPHTVRGDRLVIRQADLAAGARYF